MVLSSIKVPSTQVQLLNYCEGRLVEEYSFGFLTYMFTKYKYLHPYPQISIFTSIPFKPHKLDLVPF